MPRWLWIHTWIAIGLAIVCLVALRVEYWTGHDSPIVLLACQSPWIVLAAMLQWRGVFRRRRGHALEAGILQLGIAGLAVFVVVANVGESINKNLPVSWDEVAVASVVTLLALTIAMFAILLIAWSGRLPVQPGTR
jgi:hypothetical protein